MRVADPTIYRNSIYWVQNDRENMVRAQEQLSTGKQVNRPSDDPVSAARVLEYRTAMEFFDQTTKRIDRAISMQTAAEQSLDAIQGYILEARDIATEELQGLEDPARRRVILRYLEELLDNMVDAANARIEGKYLFGGYKNQIPPYVNAIKAQDTENGFIQYVGSVEYRGDDNYVSMEILPGVYSKVSVPGLEAFGRGPSSGEANLFDVMQALMNAIAYPDRRVIGGPAVSNKERIKNATLYLNSAYNQIATCRSYIGVGIQSLENAQHWLNDLYLHTNEIREIREVGDVMLTSPLVLDQAKHSLETTFASLQAVVQPSVIRFAIPQGS